VSDGSAKEFTEAILKAGVAAQKEPQKFFTVQTPFEYQANQTIIRIEPADTFELICRVDYNHPLLGKQEFKFQRGDDYLTAVAPARTFCFDYEIEALHKNGLAKGGTLDNAIVIGPSGIYNEIPLRFPNEFVRHKTLDLMGDLMLVGAPLRARVIATRGGHGHNIKFLKQLLQSQTAQTVS
jgi:UDP-3-O-acyl-N-acetylglucosamine deacetylase